MFKQHGTKLTSTPLERIEHVLSVPVTHAVFFDRDNTINDDKGYTHTIEDFVFFPRCFDALKALEQTDYKKIIITNQAGIGRGYYTEDDYQKLTQWMLEQFKKEGITIDAVYHCPHAPGDGCAYRKPKNGMILKAASDLGLNLSKSWMIGDKDDDVLVGRESNMKTVKIGKPVSADLKFSETYTAVDIYDAVQSIIDQR